MGAQGAGPDRDRATSKACWFLCLLEYLPSVNPNYVVIFGARSYAGSCKDMPVLEKKFEAVLAICYKWCVCVCVCVVKWPNGAGCWSHAEIGVLRTFSMGADHSWWSS